MRIREMGGDGGNHHEKLGHKRCSGASQFTIPDTASMTPNPAGMNTNTRLSKLNQASCTPDFSYPPYCSHFYHPSLLLVHYSTIITEHKLK